MAKMNRIGSTKCNGFFVAVVAFIALVGVAQNVTMRDGFQQRNQVGVNKCLSMPHDQMMTDPACKTMMAVHPESFPAATVKPQTAPSR